jgi:hypothetical protein
MSKTTAIANTTYFLDVVAASSDFSWGTAHPAGTYVTIATITTDLNAQIATITDTRPLTAELFKGFDCKIVVPDLQTQVDTIGEDLDAAETVIAALQQGATTTSNSLTALSETVEVHTGDNALHDKAFRIGHTYAIPGEIKVPSGDTNYVIPFFVSLVTGQTAKLAKCRYRINSGTSVTCKLQKNGADITGYTGMSVTTTTAQTDADDVTLADNDMLALIVTAVSGTPKNMTFTLFIDYEQ